MSSAQTLRYLILAMWGTAIAGAVLDVSLESQLPEPLRNHLATEWARDLTPRDGLGAAASVAVLWFMVRGSIQLYRFRATGRRNFLVGFVLSILMTPLMGPVIYNAWSPLFDEASIALGGVIVGWLYLSHNPPELSDRALAKGEPSRPPPIG